MVKKFEDPTLHEPLPAGKTRSQVVLESLSISRTIIAHTGNQVADIEETAKDDADEYSPEELKLRRRLLKGGRRYLVHGEDMPPATALAYCAEGASFELSVLAYARAHALDKKLDPDAVLGRAEVRQRLAQFEETALRVSGLLSISGVALAPAPTHHHILPPEQSEIIGARINQ